MVIPQAEGPDVIIPFIYSEGNHVIPNEMPTEEDKNSLSIYYEITGTEGWDPTDRPTESFDQSVYDNALSQCYSNVRNRLDPVTKQHWMEHLCISDEKFTQDPGCHYSVGCH